MLRNLSEPRFRNIALALAVAGIFLVALAVRLYGINFGLPYAEEVDEPAIMDHVAVMVRTGDWSPHWFNYGALYVYAQAGVTLLYSAWAQAHGILESVGQLEGAHYPTGWLSQPDLYLWARALSALLGASTVIVLYKAASELYSRAVGLVAASILALTFLHSQYSHYIRTDIPLALFAPLTLLASAYILRSGRLRDYAFAGIAVGLTVASKYNGVVVALIVAVAHFARLYRPAVPGPSLRQVLLNPRTHAPLLLAAVVSLVTFFATCPTTLWEWDAFQAGLKNGTDTFGFGGLQPGNAGRYLDYLMFRGGVGDLLMLIAIAGLGFALVRHRRVDVVALVFPLVYFLMTLFGAPSMFRIRMALPLTPFLALLAALALVQAIEWIGMRWKRLAPLRTPLIAALTVGLLVGPAQHILADDASMATSTTRAEATDWIGNNLGAGARILSEENGVYIDAPQVPIEPASLDHPNLSKLQDQTVDYIVTVDDSPPRPLRTFDSALTAVRTFSNDDHPGPVVRIFQVQLRPLPLELIDLRFDRSTYAPGQQATVVLHWRLGSELPENYTEFIRLQLDGAQPAFELAEAPQRGNGKTKRWPVSQVITDTHSIDLPGDLEDGQYQVQVGFYRQGTEFTQPVMGPNGASVPALIPATIEIKK